MTNLEIQLNEDELKSLRSGNPIHIIRWIGDKYAAAPRVHAINIKIYHVKKPKSTARKKGV